MSTSTSSPKQGAALLLVKAGGNVVEFYQEYSFGLEIPYRF